MRILIVEDDKDLCDGISLQLKKEGYETDICMTGEEALYYIKQYAHDIIILDRMLPEIDGLTITSKIRKQGIFIPIIMVTALNGIYDRIDGLDAGADDYLVKPFAMDELLARIRALLRRPRKIESIEQIQFADLLLDTKKKILRLNTDLKSSNLSQKSINSMTLSKKESFLLEFFIKNPNQIITREQILARIWGDDDVEEGNIDNYIHFLRRRLKSIGSSTKIKTVYGIGYQLEEAK